MDFCVRSLFLGFICFTLIQQIHGKITMYLTKIKLNITVDNVTIGISLTLISP